MNKKDLQNQVALLAEAFLRVTEENTNLRKRLESAEKNASTDHLTGLGNLRFANEEVNRLKSLSGRYHLSSVVCVMFIDVDNLKQINDRYGHSSGNMALCAVAEALKSVMRANDIVARIGGDEFAVVALCNSDEEMNILRKKVEDRLKRLGVKEKISVSIGVHCDDFGPVFNLEEALNVSDAKMYKIKQQKKGQ